VSRARPYIGWYEESERTADEGEPIPEKSRESRLRREVRELKCLVAKQALEVDFFRGALQKIEAVGSNNTRSQV